MNRPAIPKAIREEVMAEYSHLCAICRKPRPQIHHIDENRTNNSRLNLLPLCPNHHLNKLHDPHNPTNRIDAGRVRWFREHKDPSILLPQFEPVYRRFEALFGLRADHDRRLAPIVAQIEDYAHFVGALEMGTYYAQAIRGLVGPIERPAGVIFLEGPAPLSPDTDELVCRSKLINKLNEIGPLVKLYLIEQLRYQDWPTQLAEEPDGR